MPCLTLIWKARGKPLGVSHRLPTIAWKKSLKEMKKKDFSHSPLENFFKGKEEEEVFHSSTVTAIITIN